MALVKIIKAKKTPYQAVKWRMHNKATRRMWLNLVNIAKLTPCGRCGNDGGVRLRARPCGAFKAPINYKAVMGQPIRRYKALPMSSLRLS